MVKCIWCGEEIEGTIRDHMAEKHLGMKKNVNIGAYMPTICQTPQIAPSSPIAPENTTKFYRVIQTEKPFIGKNRLGYYGMNWYAAQALLENPEKEYPYGKDVIFVPAKEKWIGEREWTETHEKLEVAELKPVFEAKGHLTLEDYYDGHIEVLKKMKDLDLNELEHTEAPYVLQKIKAYLGVKTEAKTESQQSQEKPKKHYLNAEEIITLLHNVNQSYPTKEVPGCPLTKRDE